MCRGNTCLSENTLLIESTNSTEVNGWKADRQAHPAPWAGASRGCLTLQPASNLGDGQPPRQLPRESGASRNILVSFHFGSTKKDFKECFLLLQDGYFPPTQNFSTGGKFHFLASSVHNIFPHWLESHQHQARNCRLLSPSAASRGSHPKCFRCVLSPFPLLTWWCFTWRKGEQQAAKADVSGNIAPSCGTVLPC